MLNKIPVSLSEILEVRGTGLGEDEIWALLAQGIRPLQSLIEEGRNSGVQDCAVSIDTFFVLADGTVELKLVHKAGLEEPFKPPEYKNDDDEDFMGQTRRPEGSLEKACIYSYGACLLHGWQYCNGNSVQNTSPELLSLLNLMTVRDTQTRPTLARLAQMSSNVIDKRRLDSTALVLTLHSAIMGTEDELDDFNPDGAGPSVDGMDGMEIDLEEHDKSPSSLSGSGSGSPPKAGTAFEESDVPVETSSSKFAVFNPTFDEPSPSASKEEMPIRKTSVSDAVKRWNSIGKSSPIGSPAFNSTAVEPKTTSRSREESFNSTSNNWVNFDSDSPVKNPLAVSRQTREDSFVSSSGDELGVSSFSEKPSDSSHMQTKDPFAYDQLAESFDAINSLSAVPEVPVVPERKSKQKQQQHKVDSFSEHWKSTETTNNNNNKLDPFSAYDTNNSSSSRSNNTAAIINEQKRKMETEVKSCEFDHVETHAFASPKDHGRLEKARSCHSLDCQFCSPLRTSVHREDGDDGKASLPNLVSGAESTCPHRDQHRQMFAKQFKPASADLDPFASFENLSKPSDERNFKPKPRVESTTTEASAEDTEPEVAPLTMRPFTVDLQSRIPAVVVAETTPPTTTNRVDSPDSPQINIKQSKPDPPDLPSHSNDATTTPTSRSRFNDENDDGLRYSQRRQTGSMRRPKAAAVVKNGTPKINEMSVDGAVPLVKPRTKSNGKSAQPLNPRKAMGGPEFLVKSRLPSIRLKAPATKRQKLLQRSESTSLQVVLLCGQRVEVACKTDSTAGDVFESVVTHTNLTEHYFFGLTHMQDGEHFFLEPEQRLEKAAPPGWKQQRKNGSARSVYTMYLRLKYYPTTLDYIKTEHTLHEMYLQLRRDVIDERLHTDRDAAYQLAALALQAEYGDRPTDTRTYFQPDHYLPHRHFLEELGGEERIRAVLSELHSQYSGLTGQDAEAEYLKTCQSQKEYGIHFHRLYRTKPSLNLAPTPLGDPDTGTPLWIGIMPRGVIVFEERGGDRVPISQHPWHLTQTLQFDRKRFVIVTQSGDVANPSSKRLVFYTDNYKKSSYFVQFATVQHRFCMKMRGWAATLASDPSKRNTLEPRVRLPPHGNSMTSSGKSSTDSGVPDLSREASPDEKLAQLGMGRIQPVAPPRAAPRPALDQSPLAKTGVIDISVPSADRSFDLTNNSMSASFEKRLDEQAPALSPVAMEDCTRFKVKLKKDTQFGLGLTLVDGEIQGMKGVYVKSLTQNGPAEMQGRMKVGDRIISVNGTSLDKKNRHDAVELVKHSGQDVQMEILRLKSLYSSSEESVHAPYTPTTPKNIKNNNNNYSNNVGAVSFDTQPSVERPARVRAVSDMSSRSGSLPVYNSQDILHALMQDSRLDGSHHRSKSQTLSPAQLSLAVPEGKRRAMSSVSQSSLGSRKGSGRSSPDRSSGEYHLHANGAAAGAVSVEVTDKGAMKPVNNRVVNDSTKSPSQLTHDDADDIPDHNMYIGSGPPPRQISSTGLSSMYSGLQHDSDSDDGHAHATAGNKAARRRKSSASSDEEIEYGSGPQIHSTPKMPAPMGSKGSLPSLTKNNNKGSTKSLTNRSGDLDWVDQISFEEQHHDDDEEDEDLEDFSVTMEKNEKGSLGIKIAGGGQKKIYIKALVADPALSCPNLRPGDRLVTVNGKRTEELHHEDVVNLLKHAQSPVTLGLQRSRGSARSANQQANGKLPHQADSVETITVILEKPISGSLGLSLAKPSGGSGIYIRVITPGSVAEEDGRIKVGDRLWEINGDSVAEASPLDVVEKLKAAEGFVQLIVKRENAVIPNGRRP